MYGLITEQHFFKTFKYSQIAKLHHQSTGNKQCRHEKLIKRY